MSSLLHSSINSSTRDELRLLHLIWEHPTKLVGGLGVAGAGLCDALAENDGVTVQVISPGSQVNHDFTDLNSYQLDIDIENALKLQAGVEAEQDLVGITGAVADFTREVIMTQLKDEAANQCAVVHVHDWMTAAAGVSMQRAQGIPLILHVHSTQVDREGEHAKGAVYQHEKWAMQQADVIIAVSDFTKGVIMEHYGISGDKIQVVRNAGGEKMFLTENFLAKKEPIVMFAGRLVGQKYPEVAVEIMAGALQKVEDARGVIAGGGEKLESIRSLVKFKGMDDRIEVLGAVPYQNMKTIYETASVLILPSMAEPFGLVAMEAAGAGVAVMLSDRCGVSEVLKSAQVIDVYDIGRWIENLVMLLGDTGLREDQARQQWSEVSDYAWSDAGEAVLGVVDELLK